MTALRVVRFGVLLLVGTVLGFLFAADGLRVALPDRTPAPAADAATHPRFVVLGFDGVDHRILGERMARGECPNLRALGEDGFFGRLETELPPESPVAWGTLLTGVNPGRHGIPDFVRPTPTYRPENGMVEVVPMRLFWRFPVRLPVMRSRLRAPTFLEEVWKAGHPVLSLRQPHAFPVTGRDRMRLLSGLGTPDGSGSAGLYTVWSNRIGFTAGDTTFGGQRVPLVAHASDPDLFETFLPGPFDPTLPRGRFDERQRAQVPVRLRKATLDGKPAVRVVVGGQEETVLEGERSRFFDVEFRFGTVPSIALRGYVRFEVLRVDPLTVMADPVQPDPASRHLPLTSPKSYGRELLERYGRFETGGWSEQTFALNDRFQDDRGFLRDLLEDMDRGAGMLLGELRRGGRCVFCAFTATDRAYHGFYRYYDVDHPLHLEAKESGLTDPAGEVFARMDRIVGEVRALLDPQDVLFVVSDHGFQTWRWAVNVNQWLVDEGYMVLRDGTDVVREKVLKGLFSGEIPPSDVDWTRTKAYAMGLGQVFLNRRGREAFGIVGDEEAPALVEEISAKLRKLRNPHAKDETAITDVYPLHRIWKGPYVAEAAEMQIGFANGYRISWQTALLGGMSRHGVVIEENRVPWSGDHCSTDPRQVPGVLLCNRRIAAPPPEGYHLRDVAPTVLSWYGLDWSTLDGKPIPLEPP